jgi:hypothetical protein
LPFLALVLALAALALAPRMALGLGTLYAVATLAEAARVGRRDGWRVSLLTWAVFPVLLVAHGAGFGVGLLRYSLAPDW